jgi:hypothetical protein
MRSLPIFAFASLVLAAGCPGPSNDDLVGTWQQVQTANDDPVDRETLVLNDDGTYSRADTSGTLDTGTFDTDGDRVTIHANANGEQHEIEEGFVVAGDQLAVGTLTPDGDVDGLVGSWHGELHQDGATTTLDFDLHADSSMHYHADSTSEGATDLDGTWRDEGGDLIITVTFQGVTGNLYGKYIAGEAIADKLYQRRP